MTGQKLQHSPEPQIDEVVEVLKEPRTITIRMKNGTSREVDGELVTTRYKSGRQDAQLRINAPLAVMGEAKK